MSRQKGFSIAELITVVAIVAILAAAALPVTRFALRRRKEMLLRDQLTTITAAIDRYADLRSKGLIAERPAINQDMYPKTLEELTTPIALIDGQKLTLLRERALIDPMTGRKEWTARASNDDDDSAFTTGDNVFDVHSTSQALSLDGKTRYNEW